MCLSSLFLVAEKVHRVLLQVLPPVVVAHNGLRVLVLTHHLHLPVSQARIKRPRDGRPPQVVRREVAEPGVVGPPLDDLLHHAGRERLVEVERAVVNCGLEERRVLAMGVRD